MYEVKNFFGLGLGRSFDSISFETSDSMAGKYYKELKLRNFWTKSV